MRREGWISTLVGRVRGTLLVVFAIYFAYAVWTLARSDDPSDFWTFAVLSMGWIGLLALASLMEIATRRQRYPRWTHKAILLVITAALLTCMTAWMLMDHAYAQFAVPALCLLQPAFLFAAWLLWKPIDWTLKHKLLANAAAHRSTLIDATVIGIVGSVGKTTTKELLNCVLADLSPITTPEHVNTELGVAAWLMKNVPAGAAKPLLIVEMGAYRKGEIATLCRVAQPTVGVVTALGSDHLALFGSEEAIVDANAEILAALPTDGHAFLLSDNTASSGLKTRAPCTVTLAGSADAQVRQTDSGLTLESNGARFTVALHGLHNAGNAMLAVAVARHLGVADERIRELLAGYRGSAHTFHLKKERGVLVMDDTYNVSPLSFRAAIDWAASRVERPRVLLTSGLLETGADESRFLRELGSAANNGIERVVFTTDAGRIAFAEGFGKDVELLSSSTAPVEDDCLLLCVGRMPQATLRRLLPSDK